MSDLTRREFIGETAALAAGATIAGEMIDARALAADAVSSEFTSGWHDVHDRVWIGPEYWANPLQDWRVAGGRIECVKAAPDRNVHLLTRSVDGRRGTLRLSVQIGRVDAAQLGPGTGSAGFRFGIRGPLPDFRNALIFGKGIDAGITTEGGLFIGDLASDQAGTVDLARESVELRLTADPAEEGCTLVLSVHEVKAGTELARVSRTAVPLAQLAGGVALVANFSPPAGVRANGGKVPAPGAGKFWFANWKVAGSGVASHPERTFGPILFTQYTLSKGILKMTAQMPPLGNRDNQTVAFQVQRDGVWKTLATEAIHPEARTATFRIEGWDDSRDTPYRVAYLLQSAGGSNQESYWEGVVRRDPVDAGMLTVADISCNPHHAFPNSECTRSMAQLNPDLLAFTGDQFYESTGGYGVERRPHDVAVLDMLRKWSMHGWTWRELMRDRPTVSIPDDHDVYHGNLWGEGGEPVEKGKTIERGGYGMSPEWVNVVHRTQTAHHPDPPDSTPGKQGISVYFAPLTYGRVSFAILADRQFKSAPEGKVPPTGGRADHVKDRDYDPKVADLPGLELLGERQMKFLREWAADWRGADMKGVISQTIFTAMATTHGTNREYLRADYDANGWPQQARNQALREMRRAFAFHLAGDQHLPAVVHYGIDTYGDGPVAFAGPAVNNVYPRWFEPEKPGIRRAAGAPDNTGDFRDSFDHPLTVLAVANPQLSFREDVLGKEVDKSCGLGVVRFDKQARTITVECWPLLADPSQPGTQFAGWPVMVRQVDNYGRKRIAELPTLVIRGIARPVVEVVDEASNDVLYTLRISGTKWQPHTFAVGRFTVRVSSPETGQMKEIRNVEAKPGNTAMLEIEV